MSLFINQSFCQSPVPIVVNQYNGLANKSDLGRLMVTDESGNIYVAGTTEGRRSGADYVVIKYNTSGAQLWVATYNGTGNGDDYPYAIAIDGSSNIYITGRSIGSGANYDYVTVKYRGIDGNQDWVSRFNSSGNRHDIAKDVQVDVDGNVYVTGFSDGANSINGNAITTIKYDTNGGVLWNKTYNGLQPDIYDGSAASREEGNSLALDDLGNVYVAGQSLNMVTIKYNAAGDFQWDRHCSGTNGKKALVDRDENVVVTGWGSTTVKYNGDGELLWENLYVNPSGNKATFQDMVLDEICNIYITGYSSGAAKDDFTTIKYLADRTLAWDKIYDGSSHGIDLARSITLDGLGNVYVAGRVEVKNGSKSNLIHYGTIKYDAGTGEEQWVSLYIGPERLGSDAFALATDNWGNVYVTGQNSSKVSAYDIVTIKYSSSQTLSSFSSIVSGSSTREETAQVPLLSLNSYPNPFSKATTIDFQIPQSGKVRLSVFDLSGKEVAILVNETRNAGKYRERFAANGLAAGTYYYRLQFGEFVGTRKVILSR